MTAKVTLNMEQPDDLETEESVDDPARIDYVMYTFNHATKRLNNLIADLEWIIANVDYSSGQTLAYEMHASTVLTNVAAKLVRVANDAYDIATYVNTVAFVEERI